MVSGVFDRKEKQDKSKTRGVENAEKPLRGIAQPGSASALGAEGRGFKSLCPDHNASARSSIG
tara:strand:- start:511 stop:699 length:189 start_codon:yes stop_codon:yes gene_type:complete